VAKKTDKADSAGSNSKTASVGTGSSAEAVPAVENATFKESGGDIPVLTAKNTESAEEEIFGLISGGQMFQAHALARKAFESNPNNLRIREAYSLVLLKTGAVDDAKKVIIPLLGLMPSEDGPPVIDVESLGRSPLVTSGDSKVLSGIAHIFKEAWNFSHSCNDLDIARELYFASFKLSPSPGTGINAAWLHWLTGQDDQANELAHETLKLLPPLGMNADFGQLVMMAETQLLLGREEDAVRLYKEAMEKSTKDYVPIVRARQQMLFLQNTGFRVPKSAMQALIPPTVVVFTGHMIDRPDQPVVLFPHDIEESVRQAIREKLDEINAHIGYCSASCGADLLFIEEIIARGGEINIILPFAINDFIETNVRHAGPRWEKRFEKALKNARTVSIAAEDRYLGHDMLYRFSNHVMHGSAVMRSKFLTSEPHLLAVWDAQVSAIPGGPADFIDQWTNITTLHLVDLDSLDIERPKIDPAVLESIKKKEEPDPLNFNAPARTIKAMMFSDLSGYSKLQDEHIPAFLDFLTKLEQAMKQIGTELEAVNTWGDAIFTVASNATTIAEFGLKYCDIVENLGRKYPEFPFPIRARISLHAGPVYEAEDPFIKKINFYGGHINRAARLEPVTTVGQVYATQQFVALLHAEIDKLQYEHQQKGLKFTEQFETEYVGVVTLAKNFGQQEVYHLRRH
jgi:class 3 adenylate cyclase